VNICKLLRDRLRPFTIGTPLLKTHFKFEERHIEQIRPIFDNTSASKVIEKLTDINEYYRANANKIVDKTGYTIKSLLNEFGHPRLF